MELIIGTFIRLIITVIVFAIFAYSGIRIGIYLRKRKDIKDNIK